MISNRRLRPNWKIHEILEGTKKICFLEIEMWKSLNVCSLSLAYTPSCTRTLSIEASGHCFPSEIWNQKFKVWWTIKIDTSKQSSKHILHKQGNIQLHMLQLIISMSNLKPIRTNTLIHHIYYIILYCRKTVLKKGCSNWNISTVVLLLASF